MQEKEVSFQYSMRLLWEKRWWITSVTILAIAIATAISFGLPPRYKTRALLLLQSLPPTEGLQISALDMTVLQRVANSEALWERVVADLELSDLPDLTRLSQSALINLLQSLAKTSILGKNFLEIELNGALKPELLQQIARRQLAVLKDLVGQTVFLGVERELTRARKMQEIAENHKQRLTAEADQRLADRRSALQAKRDRLIAQLEQIKRNERHLKAMLGANNLTLGAFILREEFSALNKDLQETQRSLDVLELQGREAIADIWNRLQNLDLDMAGRRITIERVEQAFSAWEPLTVVSEPGTPTLINPRRQAVIAIAGLFGLLMGVFLAFIIKRFEELRGEQISKTGS